MDSGTYRRKSTRWLFRAFVFMSLMGVIMICGSAYAVRGSFAWQDVAISIPLSFLVSLILLANELRDHERDRRCGVRTSIDLLEDLGAEVV